MLRESPAFCCAYIHKYLVAFSQTVSIYAFIILSYFKIDQ